MIRIFLIFSLLLHVGCGQTPSGSASNVVQLKVPSTGNSARCPLHVSISVVSDDLKHGKDVSIHMVLSDSVEPVWIASGPNPALNCEVRVTFPSGRVLTNSNASDISESGLRYYYETTEGSAHYMHLFPVYRGEFDLPVSVLFDLTEHGMYRVEVGRSTTTSPDGTVDGYLGTAWSNVVQFRID